MHCVAEARHAHPSRGCWWEATARSHQPGHWSDAESPLWMLSIALEEEESLGESQATEQQLSIWGILQALIKQDTHLFNFLPE